MMMLWIRAPVVGWRALWIFGLGDVNRREWQNGQVPGERRRGRARGAKCFLSMTALSAPFDLKSRRSISEARCRAKGGLVMTTEMPGRACWLLLSGGVPLVQR